MVVPVGDPDRTNRLPPPGKVSLRALVGGKCFLTADSDRATARRAGVGGGLGQRPQPHAAEPVERVVSDGRRGTNVLIT
jgi:hypothetical protein